MAEKGDFLIGRIALREGVITKEQLYDCLIAQERNPSKSLGSLLVARGALLGKILVEKGLASEYQVNECLRLQGRLAESRSPCRRPSLSSRARRGAPGRSP